MAYWIINWNYLKNHDIITDKHIKNKLKFSRRCVFRFRFWFEFIKLFIPIWSAAAIKKYSFLFIFLFKAKNIFFPIFLPSLTSGICWLFDNWLDSVATFGRGLWIKQWTTQLSNRPHAAMVFASGWRTWPLKTRRTNFWALSSSLKFRLKEKRKPKQNPTSISFEFEPLMGGNYTF